MRNTDLTNNCLVLFCYFIKGNRTKISKVSIKSTQLSKAQNCQKGYNALIHLFVEAAIKTQVKLHTAIPSGGLKKDMTSVL